MKKNVPDILLIYTGGTIGMVKDYKSNALKPFDFENIKVKIPELKLLDCKIETTAFSSPIDSSDMSPEYWVMIAEIIEKRYDEIDGFVVLTGTDTMSYTASAISFILGNLRKPVIFTGSQFWGSPKKISSSQPKNAILEQSGHICRLHFKKLSISPHPINLAD